MTPDERQMLADLFERIRSTNTGPRDPQAEAFINDSVRAVPYAPYALAHTVLVQQHALEAANHRIGELEAQAKAAAAQPAPTTSFLGGLFGGGAAQPPAPPRAPNAYDASSYQRGASAPPQQAQAPQQQYAPQQYAPPQSGPWGAPQGGGFLSGALRTAAGVAGGVALADVVGSLFSGNRGGGLFGAREYSDPGFSGSRETVNNYYNNAPDPAGQHAEDVLQDQDQDQDDAQDAQDSGGWDSGSDSDS